MRERAWRRSVPVATFWFKGPRISPGCISMAELLIRARGIPCEGIHAWRGVLNYFKDTSDPDAVVQLPEIQLEAIRAWRRGLCLFTSMSDRGSTASRWVLLIVQACLYKWGKSDVPDFWARGVTEACTQINNDIEVTAERTMALLNNDIDEAVERAMTLFRNGDNDNTEVPP